MYKQILTFLSVLLLCACASLRAKQEGGDVRNLKTVNFFAEGKQQVAFKVTGTLENMQMEGVLMAKRMADQINVVLLSGGLLRVLDVAISQDEVEYRYLLSEVDTALVRGRITQLLDLLFSAPQNYAGAHTKNGQTRVTYKGPRAKTVLLEADEACRGVCSTAVRDLLAQKKEPVGLVTPAVLAYFKERGFC